MYLKTQHPLSGYYHCLNHPQSSSVSWHRPRASLCEGGKKICPLHKNKPPSSSRVPTAAQIQFPIKQHEVTGRAVSARLCSGGEQSQLTLAVLRRGWFSDHFGCAGAGAVLSSPRLGSAVLGQGAVSAPNRKRTLRSSDRHDIQSRRPHDDKPHPAS